MKFTRSGILACIAWCGAVSCDESITGHQMLGSHFGVPGIPGKYDYVILGGGTAGLALAHRLAEDARYTVAVVNAGDFAEFANGNFSQIPAFASMFGGSNPALKNPLLDWGQYTTRQTQLDDRIIFYPSGKVLGGGSARNYMWFPRAHEGALKKWAELTGDVAYLFENMLPFYKKVTNFTPPNTVTRLENTTVAYNAELYDNSGPVQASYPKWANPITSWLVKGFEALGLSSLPGGLADGNLWGYGFPPSSIDPETQTRSSAETSYLRDALKKTTNMNVYKNTLAKRIMFDENKRAIGAMVESGGLEYPLYAVKEVIVSAGFVRSPQLLMVSGVGPAATLEKLGIDVVADLPGVGQNMWDHPVVSPSYEVSVLTHSGFSDPSVFVEQMIAYQSSRSGMLTNNGGDILAFSKLPEDSIPASTVAEIESFSDNWPHMQYMPLNAYLGWGNDSMGGAPAGNYVSPMVVITSPFSRGNVTISSADTNDNPVVSPNWLLDPRDQQMIVAAFKRARQLMTQDATRPVVIGDEVFPGLEVSTDEEILKFVQKQVFAVHHGSCTCRMGKKDDPMAVLDSHARVYGLQNVRVVDASAFPVLPPGAPAHTVYALAEKIANDILNDDQSSSSESESTGKKDEL